jgi:hypothetical protein
MEINTLITDIQELLKRKDGWFDVRLAEDFSASITSRLQSQLGKKDQKPTLRLSQMGPRCPCALWYSMHRPDLAEPLPPWATVKYSFGHILEALAIGFSKAAGHEVTGEQGELRLDDIVGHRDCVIDGCIVDVKSAASASFNKFKQGSFTDNFGYLDQLDGYVLASKDDPLVRVKNKGYLLVIDKQLGHMCLYPHEVTDGRERALRDRIQAYKRVVDGTVPPACECGTIPQGLSGNMQLDLRASYSPYKHCCFPGVRTFIYASGPVYLSKVVKRPINNTGPIPEVNKDGKFIYH